MRETIESMTGKFGARMTREGGEALERLALKHGDEVLPIAKRLGPEFIEGIDRAGKHEEQC